jgi:hypothetical protein
MAGEEVVASNIAHEGHVQVGVRIDPSRHHVLALAIHYLGTGRHGQVRSHFLDQSVFTDHIRQELVILWCRGGERREGWRRRRRRGRG